MTAFDEVSVLAGGWSARRHDVQALPGLVIGVNESAVLARCHIAVSMDRLWTEARWARLLDLGIPAWLRRAALIRIPERPPWVTVFDCDYVSATMVDDTPRVLNGTNSGLCAVNLAFQLRPQVLRLYGMDLAQGPKGERHWYPPYPWVPPGKGTGGNTFAKWRQDLAKALKQCREAGIRTEVMR